MSQRRVLFVQPTEPGAYPPLINAAWLLAERGWQPTFLSAPVAGNQMRMPAIPGLRLEAGRERSSHVLTKSDYGGYCARAVALARTLRPDFVYASDPAGALPGLLAAGAAGARLLYHEHDSPNYQATLHPILRVARKAAVKRAIKVVFPNAQRADHARQELGFQVDKASIVWNLPRRAEVVPPVEKPSGPLILHYHGGIAPDRLPESLAAAASRFHGKVILRIAGYEVESGSGHVAHLCARYGRAETGGLIDAVGEVSREHLLALAATADVGLALFPMDSFDLNMRHLVGASNKPFDYMAAGLPMLVSDLPDWRATFVEPGYALAIRPDSADALAEGIRTLLEFPELRESMGAAGRARILDRWNHDIAFGPVLEAADNAWRE